MAATPCIMIDAVKRYMDTQDLGRIFMVLNGLTAVRNHPQLDAGGVERATAVADALVDTLDHADPCDAGRIAIAFMRAYLGEFPQTRRRWTRLSLSLEALEDKGGLSKQAFKLASTFEFD
jgi:hypothetical protein